MTYMARGRDKETASDRLREIKKRIPETEKKSEGKRDRG